MKFSEALTMSVAAAAGADAGWPGAWRCEDAREGTVSVVAGKPMRRRSVALGTSSWGCVSCIFSADR